MSPFDEDPSENKSEMDLCIDEIHNLQTQLATEKKKNSWIPVEERLPKTDGYYLAAEDGRFGEYWYSILGGWMHGDRRTPYNCDDRITHWMTIILPEGEGE